MAITTKVNLIAVNKNYICYTVRGDMVRVLNRKSASRGLLRGHTSAILDIQFGTHEYDWNYVEKRITLIIDTRYPLKFKIEIFARGIGDSEPHIITYHGRAKNLNRRTPITLSTGTNIFFVFR